MKFLAVRHLLLMGLSASAFAGDPIPLDETPVNPTANSSSEENPNPGLKTGSVEQLTERLASLTASMEQKVDDCDGEVANAKKLLVDLESRLAKTTQNVRQTHKELLVLKDALTLRGCEISIGGQLFSREVVTVGLEKRMTIFQSNITRLTQLRNEVANQKTHVQLAIAKLERWQAKEKELLQHFDFLQQTHEKLLNDENAEQLKQAFRFEAEVEEMLSPTDTATSADKNVTDKVQQDDTESTSDTLAVESNTETTTTTNDSDVRLTDKLPAKKSSSQSTTNTKPTAETEIEIDVDSESPIDADIDLEKVGTIIE